MRDRYVDKRKQALESFRDKKYKQAVKEFESLLEEFSASKQISLKDKSASLNNLMTAYHHLIRDGEYEKEKIKQFKEYKKEYLEVAKVADSNGTLKRWSDHIIEYLLSYNLDLILIEITENDGYSIAEMENKLEVEVKDLLAEFISVFSPTFPKKLFYDQLLNKIYQERQNFNRSGKDNYQNIRNTRWLIKIFLELSADLKDYAKKRANVMNLMADLIYFFTENQEMRGEKEKKSLRWLEKSIQEFPNNRFSKSRIKELRKILTTTQQINKFRHDATNKISYLRDKLAILIRRVEDKRLKKEFLELSEYVNMIEGIFRLTKEERANFELVDMNKLLTEIVVSNDELNLNCLTIKGEKAKVEIDKNYFVIAVHNLIKNSLEAYKRNQIEINDCPVEIEFDYQSLECRIRDEAGGIADEFKDNDKLFEPYVSSKGTYQNVGLGLAQAKAAIDLQEGRIEYQSNEQGTEFIISLCEEV